jgi:GNAT superfamily N-acetyltransferase
VNAALRGDSQESLSGVGIRVWQPSALEALLSLCQLGFDQVSLSEDDLDLCFPSGEAEPSVVLGTEDHTACVVLRILEMAPQAGSELHRVARVELLVTHPSRRRRGLARKLLLAGERWARENEVTQLVIGGTGPVGVFSGVDLRWTAALCLAESMGYQPQGIAVDLSCATVQTTRTPSPAGVQIARVESDAQVEELLGFVQATAPAEIENFLRAASAGTALIAVGPGNLGVRCAAAHSVYRLGVIGPIVFAGQTDTARQALQHDSDRVALLSAVLATMRSDLAVAGLTSVEILGEGCISDYVAACAARTGRVSQVFSWDLSNLRAD